MPAWIAQFELIGGWLAPSLIVVGAVLLLAVAGLSPSLRWIVATGIAAVAGAALGLGLCWLLGDQLNLFEVSLSPVSRAWAALAFAGLGVAVVGIVRGRALRRVGGALLGIIALSVGALGVNADFGQYTTVGSVFGSAVARPLPAEIQRIQAENAPGTEQTASTDEAAQLWKLAPAAGMPAHGSVHRVDIAGTVSGFKARPAYVYLPPAALVAKPVALPVLILLSGQPGAPQSVVSAGQIQRIFDTYAAAHDGLAPIVVVPDQLGSPSANPMCVDSALGKVATYITVDVVNWIKHNLTVQTSAAAWAIGGYSEGGTCSIQFGAGHPELFSGIVDILGQQGPFEGSVANTIATAFGGDTAKYQEALPATMLEEHAPYRNVLAVFGSGQLDTKYGPVADEMNRLAAAAGMRTIRIVSPGTAHDWGTVRYVLRKSLEPMMAHLGLQRPVS